MKKLPLMFSLATICGALLANYTFASDGGSLLNSLYANTQGNVPSLAPIIDKVTPSVVTINVEGSTVVENNFPNNFDFFFGGDPFGFNPFEQRGNTPKAEKQFRALGSGVIIDAEKGYIVTNNHVVKDSKKIKVITKDGREFEAKKVGADPQSDFALLQIEAKDLVAVKFADSDLLKVGDFAIAIGNPFGLGQTVTYGIISALGRSVDGNTDQFENYIQTDAAINQGNSGGSLVDLRGNLIGINTAIIAPSGGNVGIGFAIPSNMIKSLTEQIIKYGEVRRGFLGIMGGELTHDLAEKFGSKYNHGAFISQVMKDSAAEKAGLKADYWFWQCSDQGQAGDMEEPVDKDFWYMEPGKVYPTRGKTKRIDDDQRISIGDCQIHFKEYSSELHHFRAKPKFSMTYNGRGMRKGSDYVASAVKNTEVGTGYVIVRGIGKYKDWVMYPFKIENN